MISIKKGNYRLANICRLDDNYEGFSKVDEKEGLAIEKEINDTSTYYVIAFVKLTKDGVEIQGVDTRMLDIEDDEWPIVKSLIKVAKEIIGE